MGGNRVPTLASSTAETDGRRSKRAVAPVDHVRDEPEHRHQKDEGEPKDTIHPTDPGVLVHPKRDEEECDVEREEEQPERDRRARRGRLKRDRDVCQDDGHLDHSTARSRSRGIPSSNIYIIFTSADFALTMERAWISPVSGPGVYEPGAKRRTGDGQMAPVGSRPSARHESTFVGGLDVHFAERFANSVRCMPTCSESASSKSRGSPYAILEDERHDSDF